MESSLTVEFRLFGTGIEPSELNRALGLRATEHGPRGYVDGDMYWVLSRTRTGTIDVRAFCEEVVAELRTAGDTLPALIQKHDLQADLTLHLDQQPRTTHQLMYGIVPVTNFNLQPATMRFLAELGAPVYFEIQQPEDREE